MGKYQSGQMGQTVNLLAYAFGGSNPSLPTETQIDIERYYLSFFVMYPNSSSKTTKYLSNYFFRTSIRLDVLFYIHKITKTK